MRLTHTLPAEQQAMIASLVSQNLATVAAMNGIGIDCFCCIGC